ncbi:DUF6089 family protein [Panacibacter ginsenosidivorans]|uniref:DUF6089 family protein n=1 Tax=Panacibacter ginsenosidivorans TaxID=1813871 RepID=UPI001CEF61C4|nr:DUF6089 family protein [Panacibacter ginsenosidivorans]
MLKKILLAAAIGLATTTANAQLYESNVHQGEFGVAIGLGHYFGDLNTSASISRPKFSGGIFFIKQFNKYAGLKVAADYSRLGYSDIYSKNEVERRRNLSFNSNVWEASLSGYFNFFKFIPGIEGYNYTPYVSLGVGVFTYDPYAYLGGQKYFLRPLGTEGQGRDTSVKTAPYSTMGVSFPLSVGFKYSINENINVFAELTYRFTNTDYIDDVSTTYADPNSFPTLPDGSPSPEFLLQDRSYETGTPIGIKGRQRGNSLQKDAFATLHFGVSINLSSYKCPPNK